MAEDSLVRPATRLSDIDVGSQSNRAHAGGLSDTQKMLIEQRISNEKPSTGAAYLLCLFLGAFGIHRIYLGEKGTGIVMLILGITIVGLLVTGIWAFVDLFLIPSIIQNKIVALRQKYVVEAMS